MEYEFLDDKEDDKITDSDSNCYNDEQRFK